MKKVTEFAVTILIVLMVSKSSFVQSSSRHQQASKVETTFEIDEEQPAGTVVGSVRESSALRRRYPDEKTGKEIDVIDQLRFSFRQRQSSSPYYEYFSIDELNGEIRTLERLDREHVCPTSKRAPVTSSSSCKLLLEVSVRPLMYIQILRVFVEIRDINDNSPTFPESRTTIRISEMSLPGTSFELPVAGDEDAAPNGVQEYFLSEPSDIFELEAGVGSTPEAPVAGKDLRRRQLPGQILENSQFSGSVRLRLKSALDREKVARYRVVVVAVDGGSPPRSGSMEVDIVVVDVNDNAPRFDRPLYETEISENRKSRMPILRLRASDPDEGDNGEIIYNLIQPSSLPDKNDESSRGANLLFRIDADTGDLFPIRSIDREADGAVFYLTAVASDRGSSPLSAFVRVTIVVRDENDNAPEVKFVAVTSSATSNLETPEAGQPEIAEHATSGTFVAQVIVVDRDEGPNGSVECWTDGRQFRLEPVALSTLTEKDHQERPTSWSSRGLEEEDEDEIFDGRSSAVRNRRRRRENQHQRTNRRADRSTTSGAVGGRAEYQLRSVVSFDREVATEVVVTVFCRDAGTPPMRVAKDIVVRITDINDHAPVIVTGGSNRVHVDIIEGNVIGAEVYRVTVTDDDIGDNAKFEFEISSTEQENTAERTLSIDRNTGIVTAEVTFDYENRQLYEYLITVTDRANAAESGNHQTVRLSATTTLVLRVRDADDERPRFDRASYHFSVRENVTPGTTVGRLTATDADTTPRFSRITYRLLDSSDDDPFMKGRVPFEIDRNTGQLTTSGRIDREETSVFRFTVVAMSGNMANAENEWVSGNVADDGSASVTIYVDDENDNSPIVRFPSQVVWIHPDHHRRCHQSSTATSAGCFISRIEATDADDDENARLAFEITATTTEVSDVTSSKSLTDVQNSPTPASSSPFAIDSVTGVVTSVKLFPILSTNDQNYPSVYHLLITVKDGGQPQRSSEADLTVRINVSSITHLTAISTTHQRVSNWGAETVRKEDGVGSIFSASASILSDGRWMILFGMVCGVVVITLVTSTICCFFILRRRSKRGAKKANQLADDGNTTKDVCHDSISGLSAGGCSSSHAAMASHNRSCSALLSVSAKEHMTDESTSCALDVGEWHGSTVVDSIQGDDRNVNLIQADRKYRRMLGDYCIHRSSNSGSRGYSLDLPDMVVSHSSAAHLAPNALGTDSYTECGCSRRHSRHHHHHRRRQLQHSRRQLTASRDFARDRRSTSPCCNSSCCCSDGGSITSPFDRSATWRASSTSSPDSFVDGSTTRPPGQDDSRDDAGRASASTSMVDTDSEYSGELSSTSTCIDSGMAPSECSGSRRRCQRRSNRHHQHNCRHSSCRRNRNRKSTVVDTRIPSTPQTSSMSGIDVGPIRNEDDADVNCKVVGKQLAALVAAANDSVPDVHRAKTENVAVP